MSRRKRVNGTLSSAAGNLVETARDIGKTVVEQAGEVVKAARSTVARAEQAIVEGAGKAGEAVATRLAATKRSLARTSAINRAQAASLKPQEGSLNAVSDPGELITRTLRQEINRVSARLENGLTVLASIGSTAPFVGLFGTVWGIYHALLAVSASGTVHIDKIAGPVGEALIMTAAGLAVAIPAVLAYNAFTRVNRVTLAELDAFAHDLHAHLTKDIRAIKQADTREAA